jgi:hypothetical protein
VRCEDKEVKNREDLGLKVIPLTKGQRALVDDEDFEHLSQWSWSAAWSPKGNKYYAVRGVYIGVVKGKKRYRQIKMHRQILGVTDPKVEVDHADNDGLNNQRYNLRDGSKSNNMCNRSKTRANTSGYKGVSVVKYSTPRPYVATIKINSKQKHLGVYPTALLAAKAYNEAAIKYHGEFARLNEV